MNPRSLFGISISVLLAMADAVAQPDEVTKLSPAGVPVVSQVRDLRIATVFPSEGTARLLIFKGPALISGSAPFEFPTSANFGAAWVERIEISSSSRFVVRIRVRQTCGPGIYDYSFVQQQGKWFLAQLEREELRCSDSGITSDWKKTYNYLGGTLTAVEYQAQRPRTTHSRLKVAQLTPFEEFQALESRYE